MARELRCNITAALNASLSLRRASMPTMERWMTTAALWRRMFRRTSHPRTSGWMHTAALTLFFLRT